MASRIQGITVEIGGDTTKLQTALKGVNSEIKSTETQLKDVEKLLKLDPSNTELLAQKQSLLTKAVEDTSTKLQTLKTAAEQATTALANGEISQQQYDALQREIIATEQSLESLTRQANESSVALQKLATTGENLKSMGDSIESVGNKIAPVSAAVTAVGVGAVTMASNFESSMSQVQATLGITSDEMSNLNGESVNTMDSLSDLAKQMGTETEHSASSCAEAINYLALAGYDTQQIFDTLPMVLSLASAGGLELANASDMVTDAMSALGLEVTEADSMVDQMAKTSQKTNTSVAQLGEGILTVGATAQSMAGGTAELNTALGILADNGIKGSEGGTALRNVILSLQTPTDQARALMESLGVAVYDSEGEMRGMNDILGDLNSSMDDMTSEEKSNVIGTIFNKTDLAAVNALLGTTGDEWDNLQTSITDSAGAAGQMADTQLDNLQGQLTILKSALEGLAISFGETLMPMVKNVATSVQGFVDWLNSMDETTQQVIVGVGLFVAALGPVLIIVGNIITAIGTIMSVLPALGTAITAVKTAFAALNLTMLANPIVLIIAAITALVAAFIYLWNTNEDFRSFFENMWEGIQDAVHTVCLAIVTFQEEAWSFITSFISDSIQSILGFFQGIMDFVGDNWQNLLLLLVNPFAGAFALVYDNCEGFRTFIDGIVENIKTTVSEGLEEMKSNISEGWETIKTNFTESLENVKTKVFEGWENIKTTFSNAIENVKANISAGWENIKSIFSNALSTISSGVSTSFHNMFSAIKEKISNIVSAISNGLDSGVSYVKDLISKSYTWGADLISGLVNGIKNSISKVTSAVKDVANTIWSYLHFSVPEVGPLTDYETWMPDFLEGLAKGIDSNKDVVTKAIDGLASDMVFSPNVQNVGYESTNTGASGSGLDVSALSSAITSAMEQNTGDTVIPIYLGTSMIEEIVVNANQRVSLRSGGH